MAFFIEHFCLSAVLPLNFVNYILKTNISVENNYFYDMIVINYIENNDSECIYIQL